MLNPTPTGREGALRRKNKQKVPTVIYSIHIDCNFCDNTMQLSIFKTQHIQL